MSSSSGAPPAADRGQAGDAHAPHRVPCGAGDARGHLRATRDRAAAELCRRRYAAIPPIREVRDQAPTWAWSGSRRLVGADGATMLESITSFDPPRSRGYELPEITGPPKPRARSVDGLWSIAPAGTGCRVTWQWTVPRRGRVAALGMPLLGRMWHGYARWVLEDLERLLLR